MIGQNLKIVPSAPASEYPRLFGVATMPTIGAFGPTPSIESRRCAAGPKLNTPSSDATSQ